MREKGEQITRYGRSLQFPDVVLHRFMFQSQRTKTKKGTMNIAWNWDSHMSIPVRNQEPHIDRFHRTKTLSQFQRFALRSHIILPCNNS